MRTGEAVIRVGVTPEHVYAVLEGEFVVSAVPSLMLSEQRVGPGALLREIAFLRCTSPRRSVHAATDGLLLCIRSADVDARVREDPAFGGRFPAAIAELARRHREHGVRANVVGRAGFPASVGGEGHPGRPWNLATSTAFGPQLIEKLLEGDFSG